MIETYLRKCCPQHLDLVHHSLLQLPVPPLLSPHPNHPFRPPSLSVYAYIYTSIHWPTRNPNPLEPINILSLDLYLFFYLVRLASYCILIILNWWLFCYVTFLFLSWCVNCYWRIIMELQLELVLSSCSLAKGWLDLNQDFDTYNKKRCFDEAFSDDNFKNVVNVPQTLPLLLLDDKHQQLCGEFEEKDDIEKSCLINRKTEVEEDFVIGWPPVKSCRKKYYQQNCQAADAANYVNVENGNIHGRGGRGGGRASNSMFVKVKMEGNGIARKIDLSLHHSYQTLIANLISMFGKCQENIDMYKLTYQDKEGDWLLAGDVPWGTFIKSVQRLKLLKKGQ